jgi:hypothetical protein
MIDTRSEVCVLAIAHVSLVRHRPRPDLQIEHRQTRIIKRLNSYTRWMMEGGLNIVAADCEMAEASVVLFDMPLMKYEASTDAKMRVI